jgi:hypothetical protein
MIIDNFDLLRMARPPFETDAPLIIDTNAPLPFSLSPQGLKPIGRRQTKILKLNRRIHCVKPHEGPLLDFARKLPRELTVKYSLSFPAMKRFDHRFIINKMFIVVKQEGTSPGNEKGRHPFS